VFKGSFSVLLSLRALAPPLQRAVNVSDNGTEQSRIASTVLQPRPVKVAIVWHRCAGQLASRTTAVPLRLMERRVPADNPDMSYTGRRSASLQPELTAIPRPIQCQFIARVAAPVTIRGLAGSSSSSLSLKQRVASKRFALLKDCIASARQIVAATWLEKML